MKKFYFFLLGIFFIAINPGAKAQLIQSVAQKPGPFDRSCKPQPGLDSVSLTRQPKRLPMSAEQRQAYLNNRQNPMIVVPPGCTDLIVDGGFETGGIPNTFWNPETSTNFGTPLCDVPSCGTGGGASPPRTGAFWAWFGGIPAPETATLGQTMTIPVGTATLNFWMRIGTVSSPFTDVLNVRVDGLIVLTYIEPAVAEGAYTLRVVNLNAFADGGSHQILFEYIGPTSGTGSFVVDDVELASCPPPCVDLVVDGGFETGGIPNTFWNPETSTNFGTPLCDVPSCGTGGGASPPRTGAFWAWFGGIPAPETATLGQTMTIPVGTATLNFWMRIGTVSSPFTDVLNVRVDGLIVLTYIEPAVAEGAYTLRVVNLNAFADGGSHQILFEYIGPTSGTGSFVVDDVELQSCTSGASCTLTCPANVTQSNDPNQCGAVVTYPPPTTTGTCGTVTSSPASGSFFPVGTTTVTATSSIGGGTCTFTVTVNDTQPPTVTCPADIILCGSQAVSFTVTASDNCPGVTVVSVPVSGSVFPVGTTTVTATATDGSGNTATCSFTVTIRPIPSVNPVPNQTVCNGAPTAPVIFSGPVPGTTFNWVNNTPSIGLAASGSGNIASFNAINLTNTPVTATITVTPVTIPSGTVTFNYTGAFQNFVVPAGVTSISIQASGAQGNANAAGVSQGGLGGSASGNLVVTPGETLFVNVGGGGITSITGGFNGGGNAGTTGTCLTARGGGGGGASDVRQITNTLAGRRIVGGGGGGSAGNRVAACSRGAGGGGGGGYYGGGGGCGYPGIAGVVPTGGTQIAGGSGGITGTTFGATNGLPGALGIGGAGGNEAASNQAGSQAVIFGSGAGGGLTGGSGQQSGLNNFTGQSGAGGSSYIGGVTGGTTTTGVRSGNGLVTISYATPGPTCTGPSTSFTITVNPTPNAVATPPTQTICSGTAMTPIVLSGNVSGTVFNWTRNNIVNITGIPNSGSGNISGTPINNTTVQQTVIFTITPVANGCTGPSITATLIVNKAPTITCPANITVNNTPGQCGAIVTYPPATATGSPAPVITYSQASGTFFPVGTTTVTATATNICGVASCTFTITVLDVQAPTITCPADIVRNTDVGVCTATIAVPNPVTGDNCAVTQLTWVMTGATTGASPATGINFVGTQTFNLNGTTGQGITTIVYTVRDAAGNTTTCSFTVTVNDIWIPVIGGQPSNQTVCVGSNAVFSVTATVPAGNPLTYQWQAWNGSAWVNIAGATNATLTLNAVTFSMNTNSYRVILTGRCSVVTSGFATLYVNQLPTINLLASGPLALLPAQSVTLTAVVSPGGGTYQWFKNGVAIAGATGASLVGLTVNDIGTYRVRYTDLNGCVATSADMVVSGQVSDNLYVYPNPNDGNFHVRFYNQVGEEVTVNVFDAKGALIYSRKTITTTPYTDITVDLGGRNTAGTYLVVLRDASGRQVGAKKIIVYDR